ncbi:hypothetical protein WN55_05368 [Dufourea novaeangliae]|uniref:Uncharacterized protein n=1 Tax=Dufourea novaeangliae TaxID=178035 RepID=A0A154PMP1_DUFNO|nr:hypothetical protein WN55_05368 [Dufourea novaeangliae]
MASRDHYYVYNHKISRNARLKNINDSFPAHSHSPSPSATEVSYLVKRFDGTLCKRKTKTREHGNQV